MYGKGTYFLSDGRKYVGKFKNGRLIGKEAYTKIIQIQIGETLWDIARAQGISVEELLIFNDINPQEPLRLNQKLRVPTLFDN